MPDSVTELGVQSFAYASKLEEIVFSKNLKTIGKMSFHTNRSLKKVDLPDSVTTIAEDNFKACYALKYINIPNKITRIESGCFALNKSLTAIIIPDNVTYIGDHAFDGGCEGYAIVASKGSVAESYAAENDLKFVERGQSVSYKAEADSGSNFKAVKNGSTLGSTATLETGDVIRLTATTALDDINVKVNGKSINYMYDQQTKSELVDIPYVITEATNIKVTSVSSADNLNDTLNVDGGTLEFAGSNYDIGVDKGNRVVFFNNVNNRFSTISTTVKLDEPGFLQFDLKTPMVNVDSHYIVVTIDGEQHKMR